MSYSKIWCEELDGSPSEQGSNDKNGSFSASVQLKCRWEDRYALLEDIIGNMSLYPHARDSGARAVNGTSKPWRGCTKRDGGDAGKASYEFAEVNINYQLQAEGQDLISESLTPTLEMMTLDYRRFTWATSVNAAYMAPDKYKHMMIHLQQALTLIQEYKFDSVDRAMWAVMLIISNAAYSRPWTLEWQRVDGIWKIRRKQGTGGGTIDGEVKDWLQGILNSVWTAAMPQERGKKAGDKPGDPQLPPDFDTIVDAANSVLIGQVGAAGPVDWRAKTTLGGTPDGVIAAFKACIARMTPRYIRSGEQISEGEAPAQRMPGLEYSLTFYKVESLPAWLLTYMGCVNAAPVQSQLLGLVFAPGTLMFDAPNVSRKWNFTSFPYWQVEYKFKFRPQGWNTWWRTGLSRIIKGSDGRLYQTAGGFDSMMVNIGTEASPIRMPYIQFPPVDFSVIWGMGGGGATTIPTSITMPKS